MKFLRRRPGSASGTAAIRVRGQVNINTADAETISAELKGIGLSKARQSLSTARNMALFEVLKTCRW